MKILFFFILFSISISAQKSNIENEQLNTIGVVAANKMNVVYRGIVNPISIAVPNCKSFTATGKGLTKVGSKYKLSPGTGLFSIINLNIILNDGSEVVEEHKFRIFGIPHPTGTLDGRNCYNCIVEMTKKELFDSKVSYKLDGFPFDLSNNYYNIGGFNLKHSKNKKIVVSGNLFTKEINELIKKLKVGSIFTIEDIYYSFPGSENYNLPRIYPIKIMIIEEEVPYFQSKEFIKDSLQNIRKEKKELRLKKKNQLTTNSLYISSTRPKCIFRRVFLSIH